MKKLLLGLALAGVCASVCAAPAVTGFEKVPGFSKTKTGYTYYDDKTGTIWTGKLIEQDGVKLLQMVTTSYPSTNVSWIMLSHLKGRGDDVKSTVQRVETTCQGFRRRDTVVIYFDGYLGKGAVDFGHEWVRPLDNIWYKVGKKDPLFATMVYNCGILGSTR